MPPPSATCGRDRSSGSGAITWSTRQALVPGAGAPLGPGPATLETWGTRPSPIWRLATGSRKSAQAGELRSQIRSAQSPEVARRCQTWCRPAVTVARRSLTPLRVCACWPPRGLLRQVYRIAGRLDPVPSARSTRSAMDLARHICGQATFQLRSPSLATTSMLPPRAETQEFLRAPERDWRTCPRRDSSPYSAVFKTDVSAVWTTRASECCAHPRV